jgi:hypothetical protein
MKRVLSVLLLAILFSGLFLVIPTSTATVTEVSGIIKSDTTWYANDIYELTGPIKIQSGVTLIIEPGTTVNFDGYYIEVNGALIAKGSSGNPIHMNDVSITFFSDSKAYNEQEGSGCILQTIVFSYPGFYSGSRIDGIDIQESSPKIIECTKAIVLVNGGSPVIKGNSQLSLQVYYGSPEILENSIVGLSIYAGSPLVAFNTITCHITSSADYSSIYESSPTIWANTITYSPNGEQDQGISLIFLRSTRSGVITIAHNTITGLVTPSHPDPQSLGMRTVGPYSCFTGVFVLGNAHISNNLIQGCTQVDLGVSTTTDFDANIVIEKNTLNNSGLLIKGKVTAVINQNNIACGLTLSENSPNNVDATNNWWGTTDNSAIDKLITDSNDNFKMGTVNYTPIRTQANTQAVPEKNVGLPTILPWTLPTVTPNPTGTQTSLPSENPTSTATSQVNMPNMSATPDWLEIGIFLILAVIAALLAGILINLKRKKS